MNAVPSDTGDCLILSLYINGQSTRGSVIVERLNALLCRHLSGGFSLDVFDVSADPSVLERDDVIALPTLVKRKPGAVYRLVGDLSDEALVLRGMGLAPLHPPVPPAGPAH